MNGLEALTGLAERIDAVRALPPLPDDGIKIARGPAIVCAEGLVMMTQPSGDGVRLTAWAVERAGFTVDLRAADAFNLGVMLIAEAERQGVIDDE